MLSCGKGISGAVSPRTLMKTKQLLVICGAMMLPVAGAAQVQLSPVPSFALGQPPSVRASAPKSSQPNLVEGREFAGPHSVAVDLASGALYVADTGNNRVLGWRDARTFLNGATADIVIGQRDLFSTSPGGPGTSLQSGLQQPTAVAVDTTGNLYVADAGNNRILRYPRPFEQEQEVILADLVLGQPNLFTDTRNTGGLSASSVNTTDNRGNAFRTGLAFDADGNLYFSDAGNHRILRYPAAALGEGAEDGPDADLVLGQPDFQTADALARNANNRLSKEGLREPSGLALDASGRLFVADALNRVVVYEPPLFTGKPASRIMGIVVQQQGQPLPPPINDRSLGIFLGNTWLPPEGVFTIGDIPFVLDTPANRILRYAPFDDWPPEDPINPSPAAQAVIGQDSFTSDEVISNRGRAEPGADTFSNPISATVAFGKVFVADSGNNRVLVFPDLSTGPETAVGAPYAAERVLGQPGLENRAVNRIEGREFFFNGPVVKAGGIAIDRNSDPPRLYVADANNNRVLGFADARRVRNGTTADIVIGQPGMYRSLVNFPTNDPSKPNQSGLFLPTDVAVDAEGNLWVADRGNSRVLRFPKPFEQQPGLQEADLVLGQSDFTTRTTDATSRTMAAPFGLAFTVEGGLLVSDVAHNRVLLFEPPLESGMAASKVFGQPDFVSTAAGNALYQLNGPRGISTDTSDRLYVSDTNNNRVLVFGDIRLAGSGVQAVLPITGLKNPWDVYVSPVTGKAWVADTNRNQVLQYPQFDTLLTQGAQSVPGFGSPGPMAVTEDPFGDLYIADAYNRVVGHFPALVATNGANFLTRIAPGMITALWFPRVDSIVSASAASLPLPTVLSDVQVLVDGAPVPLYFVSPQQINILMPNDAPTTGTVEVTILRPSTRQILATNVVPMDIASPGLFTIPPIGKGQIAALNNRENVVTINSEDNPAKPGEYVSLYGTGAGHIPGAPPDGEAATGLVWTPVMPRVAINGIWLPESDIQYSGLAPGFAGVWQINVKVPETTPDGDVFVVVVMYDRPSGDPSHSGAIVTTIAVKR